MYIYELYAAPRQGAMFMNCTQRLGRGVNSAAPFGRGLF